MGPATPGASVPFRVHIDGKAPGDARGFDVDEQGNGTLADQRHYQLIRQTGSIQERRFEIEFARGRRRGVLLHLRLMGRLRRASLAICRG